MPNRTSRKGMGLRNGKVKTVEVDTPEDKEYDKRRRERRHHQYIHEDIVGDYDNMYDAKRLVLGFVVPPVVCRNLEGITQRYNHDAWGQAAWQESGREFAHADNMCIEICSFRRHVHALDVDPVVRQSIVDMPKPRQLCMKQMEAYPDRERAAVLRCRVGGDVGRLRAIRDKIIHDLGDNVHKTYENFGFPNVRLATLPSREQRDLCSAIERIMETPMAAANLSFKPHFIALFERAYVDTENDGYYTPGQELGDHERLFAMQYYPLLP